MEKEHSLTRRCSCFDGLSESEILQGFDEQKFQEDETVWSELDQLKFA
jgi:hypothetical protein